MNRATVVIYVLPDRSYINGSKYIGNIFSDINNIRVNKIDTNNTSGYTILFTADVFNKMNPETIERHIRNMFGKNLPTTIVDAYLDYLYNDDIEEYQFDMDTAYNVVTLSVIMTKVRMSMNDENNLFIYHVSNRLKRIIEKYNNLVDDMEEDLYNDQYDYNNTSPEVRRMIDIVNSANNEIEYDDYKPKKRKKYYNTSRILKSSKSPKKMYRRHGVLVCNKKRCISTDKDTIKEFLKEFIPGNQEWKKELRRELAKRWIKTYMVTSGQLKKYEKECNKKKKKSNINTDKVLDITRRIFATSDDIWSDPRR